MRYVWDEDKNRRNRLKHKVSFDTAALVFDDPHAVSLLERVEGGEERWQTLGLIGGTAILLVAHLYYEDGGEEVIRIISARKATAHERRVYEEGFKKTCKGTASAGCIAGRKD
jgi:uncharacterized DUF497 family protein